MPTTDAQMITTFGRAGITVTERELTNHRDALTAGTSLLDAQDEPRAATNDDIIAWQHKLLVNNTLGYLIETGPVSGLEDVRVPPTVDDSR